MFSGKSVLSPGEATGKKETIGKLLSPLTKEEVGSIRCIGLNVSLFFCSQDHMCDVICAIPARLSMGKITLKMLL